MGKIKIIPPLHNIMVAKLFENMGSAPSALSLINAVLTDAGRVPLDKITGLRCEETLPGASFKGRSCRLDVIAEANGKRINVEVQRESCPDMVDRSFFHACAIMHPAIEKSQDFKELPRLTMINLLDFKPLRSSHPDFHQPVSLMYVKGKPETASDVLYMHNIELRKFRKIKYDKENPLHRWLHFLVKGYATINEIETKEMIKMDRGLQAFAEKYNLSLQDPLIQDKYTHHRLAELDYQTNINTAHEKGAEEAKTATAEKMILKNKPLAEIIEFSELTEKKIRQLAKKLSKEIVLK
jgi:predicted transposase/invertase (TIGR01784 family)